MTLKAFIMQLAISFHALLIGHLSLLSRCDASHVSVISPQVHYLILESQATSFYHIIHHLAPSNFNLFIDIIS